MDDFGILFFLGNLYVENDDKNPKIYFQHGESKGS